MGKKFKSERHNEILQIHCDNETFMKFKEKKIKFKDSNEFLKYLIELYKTHDLYSDYYYIHDNNLSVNKHNATIRIRCDIDVLIKFKEGKVRFKTEGEFMKYLLSQYQKTL